MRTTPGDAHQRRSRARPSADAPSRSRPRLSKGDHGDAFPIDEPGPHGATTEGIFVDSGGTDTAVALEGDLIYDGNYAFLGCPSITAGGDVAFPAAGHSRHARIAIVGRLLIGHC